MSTIEERLARLERVVLDLSCPVRHERSRSKSDDRPWICESCDQPIEKIDGQWTVIAALEAAGKVPGGAVEAYIASCAGTAGVKPAPEAGRCDDGLCGRLACSRCKGMWDPHATEDGSGPAHQPAPAVVQADGHIAACGNGGEDPEDCSPDCRAAAAPAVTPTTRVALAEALLQRCLDWMPPVMQERRDLRRAIADFLDPRLASERR